MYKANIRDKIHATVSNLNQVQAVYKPINFLHAYINYLYIASIILPDYT